MKKLILPIILLVIVGGAIFYFTRENNQEVKNEKNTSSSTKSFEPIIISDTNDSENSQNTKNNVITSGKVYIDEVLLIRKPINDKFKDYLDKIKYKTIFTDSEAKVASQELELMISEGIDKFNNLQIDKKFDEVNNQMIKSLELLKKAKDALINYTKATTAEEQQKYSDLYEYNLNQSDNLVKDIAIPQ